jgi:hypothetical protein
MLGLFPRQRLDGAKGQVLASQWNGLRRHVIGKVQTRYYQEDRTLLWEPFLNREHTRAKDPDDPNVDPLWHGFERFLLRLFPATERIAAPSWEPIYDTQRWQALLVSHGSVPWGDHAFCKEVGRR